MQTGELDGAARCGFTEANEDGWADVCSYALTISVGVPRVDLNGIQAALFAGCAADSAAAEASRLLRNAKVADAIDAAMAQRAGVTRTFIIDELAPPTVPREYPYCSY